MHSGIRQFLHFLADGKVVCGGGLWKVGPWAVMELGGEEALRREDAGQAQISPSATERPTKTHIHELINLILTFRFSDLPPPSRPPTTSLHPRLRDRVVVVINRFRRFIWCKGQRFISPQPQFGPEKSSFLVLAGLFWVQGRGPGFRGAWLTPPTTSSYTLHFFVAALRQVGNGCGPLWRHRGASPGRPCWPPHELASIGGSWADSGHVIGPGGHLYLGDYWSRVAIPPTRPPRPVRGKNLIAPQAF